MEIILTKDVTDRDYQGNDVVILTAGTRISAISIKYIPKNSIIKPFQSSMYEIADLDKRYYIIYAKGGFRAISKEDCEVPRTRNGGWTFNY